MPQSLDQLRKIQAKRCAIHHSRFPILSLFHIPHTIENRVNVKGSKYISQPY